MEFLWNSYFFLLEYYWNSLESLKFKGLPIEFRVEVFRSIIPPRHSWFGREKIFDKASKKFTQYLMIIKAQVTSAQSIISQLKKSSRTKLSKVSTIHPNLPQKTQNFVVRTSWKKSTKRSIIKFLKPILILSFFSQLYNLMVMM